MRIIRYTGLLLLLWVLLPVTASAQTEAVPTGTITGQVINQTPDGSVPDASPVRLHAWDQNFNEKLMLDGQTDATGAFEFTEVTLNPDWLYGIMLTYQDVLYFSDPVLPAAGELTLDFTVPIYETTTETAAVRIARQHVFFEAATNGLLIGEVYMMSNLGDRTIANMSGDDAVAPLMFPLPEDATNVVFEENPNGRFQSTPGGFVDTAPLRPGSDSGQVVVKYVVPYEASRVYTLQAPWPVDNITFLLPERTGLSLAGEGIVNEGVREMGDAGIITVFSYTDLTAGDALPVTLSGTLVPPVAAPAGMMEPAVSETTGATNNWLVLAGGLLGIAFILAAFWWQRQTDAPVELAEAGGTLPSFDEVVTQIARLDEAHARGEMNEETYQVRRDGLRQQAKQVLQLTKSGVGA